MFKFCTYPWTKIIPADRQANLIRLKLPQRGTRSDFHMSKPNWGFPTKTPSRVWTSDINFLQGLSVQLVFTWVNLLAIAYPWLILGNSVLLADRFSCDRTSDPTPVRSACVGLLEIAFWDRILLYEKSILSDCNTRYLVRVVYR